MLRSDQTLQDVISKILPCLQENEVKREKEFYEQQRLEDQKKIEDEEIQNANSVLDSRTEEPEIKKEKLSADCNSKENFHRDDPQIGVCLECLSDNSVQEQPVRELVRKYIRCSSRLTIAQVKKFLKVKLNLSTADQIEIMCNGEIMGKDHTLEFVYMTRWRIKEGSLLTLQYRPRMDFY